MYIGADFYPEHWPQKRWEPYAKLMQKAGFNVVRLAEFAWAKMEPEEGRFDFAWLDEAIGILGKYGVSTILGTPTGVMPAWVARKYPETLYLQKDGTRQTWGVRKNNCFTSGAFRLLSERVTRAMAQHYARTPHVIGWQTDNEFDGFMCYCDTCRAEFQDWLRAKYKTLAEVNRAWGTHFWGHGYSTWGEIQIPIDFATHNPGACLDWKRFRSWLDVRFQRDQVRIIRNCCPKHFITHNFMGLFSELDYYRLAQDLDFVSWDNYPIGTAKPDVCYDAATAADVMRGLKRKNFWIMETTAGSHGWGTFGRLPRPGEMAKFCWQQIAHGADGYLWFRWRACTAGREQYWHGLLGHDGKPQRRYKEAAQIATHLHKLEKELQGTTVKTPVAMIYDYESYWALCIQPAFEGNHYHHAVRRYHRALLRAGVNVDMISPTQDFAAYRVVIAPELYLLPDEVAKKLSAFVQRGGILLTELRTGVKDETSLCHERTLPGLLAPALGIAIEEYESLGKDVHYSIDGRNGFSGRFTAEQYADWIIPKTAEVLAGFDDWHMRKFAAATRNRFGKGAGYYVGTVVKEQSFYDALLAEVLETAGVEPLIKPPAGVEVSLRQGRGRKLLFIINHTETPQSVDVPAGKQELISGQTTGESLELPVFGVAVLKL